MWNPSNLLLILFIYEFCVGDSSLQASSLGAGVLDPKPPIVLFFVLRYIDLLFVLRNINLLHICLVVCDCCLGLFDPSRSTWSSWLCIILWWNFFLSLRSISNFGWAAFCASPWRFWWNLFRWIYSLPFLAFTMYDVWSGLTSSIVHLRCRDQLLLLPWTAGPTRESCSAYPPGVIAVSCLCVVILHPRQIVELWDYPARFSVACVCCAY